MSSRHPTIDLSAPVRARVPVVVAPEPTVVETPTFGTDEFLGLGIVAGAGVGLLVGWQACNWLTSQEFYINWATQLLNTILPVRKIQLLSGIGGIVVEVVAAALGIEVPELG